MEKKLDGNDTRMLRQYWTSHGDSTPVMQQLNGHLPPIEKIIQVRLTRHAGHCWRSRDEAISDILLWTPSHRRAKAGRPARTYEQEQLCADTGCSLENYREQWTMETGGEIGSGISMLMASPEDDDIYIYIYIYIYCSCIYIIYIYKYTIYIANIYIYIYIYQISGRIETFQTTAVLKSFKRLERVMETRAALCRYGM